jgi:uncharacterized protein YjbI with pentapeptide repeats
MVVDEPSRANPAEQDHHDPVHDDNYLPTDDCIDASNFNDEEDDHADEKYDHIDEKDDCVDEYDDQIDDDSVCIHDDSHSGNGKFVCEDDGINSDGCIAENEGTGDDLSQGSVHVSDAPSSGIELKCNEMLCDDIQQNQEGEEHDGEQGVDRGGKGSCCIETLDNKELEDMQEINGSKKKVLITPVDEPSDSLVLDNSGEIGNTMSDFTNNSEDIRENSPAVTSVGSVDVGPGIHYDSCVDNETADIDNSCVIGSFVREQRNNDGSCEGVNGSGSGERLDPAGTMKNDIWDSEGADLKIDANASMVLPGGGNTLTTELYEKVVVLDVGGYVYKTTTATLSVDSDSTLYSLVTDSPTFPQQANGSFLIDRDGRYFYVILDYLRKGTIALESVMLKPCPEKYEAAALLYSDGNFFNLKEFSSNLMVVVFTSILRNTTVEDHFLQNILRMQVLDLGDETECFHVTIADDTSQTPLCEVPRDYSSTGRLDMRAKLKKLAFAQFSWANLSIRCHTTHSDGTCEDDREKLFTQLFAQKFDERTYTDAFGKEVTDTFYYCCLVNVHFQDHFSADFCNLSGVLFRNCYFEKGADFTGSIMRGTRFTSCYGLVQNGVVFSPIQAREAVFDDELLKALKGKGCIHW